MRNRPSEAVQQTDVGQGLAVGCLLAGVVGVTSGKQAVEFAFGRAWGSWGHASAFPDVRASLTRNDILTIVHDSPRRRGGWIAYWDIDGPFWRPVLRHDWTPRNAADELAASSGVPVPAWEALAEAFLAEFRDHEVARR